DLPATCVTWLEARAFCLWYSAHSLAVRLPTEWEWEYACRAGTTTTFWSGDGDPTEDQAWYDKPESEVDARASSPGSRNPWGLEEMHGNVLEWTSTRLGDDGQEALGGAICVARGGAYSSSASDCRSAARLFWLPFSFDVGLRIEFSFGFRVVSDGPGLSKSTEGGSTERSAPT